EDPDWAEVIVYSADGTDAVHACLEMASRADLVVKASGIGVFDALLEKEVLTLQRPGTGVVFWDVDAPATLERIENDPADPMRRWIPRYDCIFTYGGGSPVVDAYRRLGARDCVPIYNAVDPRTHHPVAPDPRFHCMAAFLGNRLQIGRAHVEEFFVKPARSMPRQRFLLGGNGWEKDFARPANV